MLFSFIVPIYNVEPYLEKCVTSLMEQTYKNIEIILVNDESPDGCPEMCNVYSKMDTRVKVIHKKNGGLSDARNRGLEEARGDYVVFVDGDDYIEKDTCERMFAYAKEGYDIIIGDIIEEVATGLLDHALITGEVSTGKNYLEKALSAGKAPMAVCLNVYKMDFLIRNGCRFKVGVLHEDEHFMPQAFLKADSVVYSGIAFYHYVKRENSITTQKDKRKNMTDFYAICLELEGIYQRIEEHLLRELLLNSLVDKYLSLFQSGALYRYGEKYVDRGFVKRNAFVRNTKAKAILFSMNPILYYWVNYWKKRIVG